MTAETGSDERDVRRQEHRSHDQRRERDAEKPRSAERADDGSMVMRSTTMPAIPPESAPNARPRNTASGSPKASGRPSFSVAVATIPDRATTEPTDRSIPAVRITNVIPAAMIAVIDV